MPISTAAPKTGRDIPQRVLLGLLVACATLVAAAPAIAGPATPVPVPVQAPSGKLAYYIMQGNRIISQPFISGPACNKALIEFHKSLPADIAPMVCAHRRP